MKVAVIMGSSSDRKITRESCAMLEQFEIPYEKKVVLAYRTSKSMFDLASETRTNGYDVIVVGAGGAAHLPGIVISMTMLPVTSVPIESKSLEGSDSLLSIVQVSGEIPATTTVIDKSGAKNAGILAARILSIGNDSARKHLEQYEQSLIDKVGEMQDELQ